jgi:hypothetical protein
MPSFSIELRYRRLMLLPPSMSTREKRQVTRVNSANVLDEGLRIGEIGRRMNSKVRLVEIGVYRK